jgi:hypothetical protein
MTHAPEAMGSRAARAQEADWVHLSPLALEVSGPDARVRWQGR